MMKPKGWARVELGGLHILRRGAWYPVVDDSPNHLVVLDVAKRNVAVARSALEIRNQPPDRWSVVVRAANEPNPFRGTVTDLGVLYGVCPKCRKRAALPGRPRVQECPSCGQEFGVAWDETR